MSRKRSPRFKIFKPSPQLEEISGLVVTGKFMCWVILCVSVLCSKRERNRDPCTTVIFPIILVTITAYF